MRRFILSFSIVVLSLILILVTRVSTQAHADATSPLIIHANGDLWLWGGAGWENLTQFGYVSDPTVSPDGQHVVFARYAQMVVDTLKWQRDYGAGGGAFPSDIALLNLSDNIITPLTKQPDDARFGDLFEPDQGVMRGSPSWSPDGTQVAWSEYSHPDQSDNRIMVYRFGSDAARVLTSVPQGMGVPSPLPLTWTQNGLVTQMQLGDTAGYSTHLLAYDPTTGEPLSETVLDSSTVNRIALDWHPATFEGREYWVVFYNTAEWDVIDATNGAILPQYFGYLEVSNPMSALPAGVQMIPSKFPSLGGQWVIYSPAGVPILDKLFVPFFGMFERVVVSPDGQQVAYTSSDEAGGAFFDTLLAIFDTKDASATLLELTPEMVPVQAILWGPSDWRLRQAGYVEVPSNPVGNCDTLLPTRLQINAMAAVIAGGGPNRLRGAASASAAIIGQIPEGSLIRVLDGPFCETGIVWWKVLYDGIEGFTAESSDGSYFLEMVA